MNDSNTSKKGARKEPVEVIESAILPPQIAEAMSRNSQQESPLKIEDYMNIIEALRKVKVFRTTVPTFIPKTFIDAIEFYDDGVARRVYFYVNKTWRYVALV